MTDMKFRKAGAIAMSLAAFVMIATPADARRGGSFGNRGARTYDAPPATRTAPNQAAPVQRSAAEKPAANQAGAANAQAAAKKPGGLAKGLIGGLIAGGLLGMLMGNGFGGFGSGMLMALLQIGLIAGLAWFAFRMFRRRSAMAPAGGPALSPAMAGAGGPSTSPFANPFTPAPQNSFEQAPQGRSFGSFGAPAAAVASQHLEVTPADKATFERLLTDVQDAFAREDYAGLRARTTPEVMSYLAEELSQNATNGQRNEVSATELLEAEVAEAWSEGDTDYATIAMQYESIDVMRDRQTNAVVSGDPARPTRTTELWTFVRDTRNDWRLSAIQEA